MNNLFMAIKSILSILLLIACTNVSAQNNGNISGTLLDAMSSEKMISVTITVLDRQTNTIVKKALTDTAGIFTINNLPEGLFVLKADYLGYRPFVKDSIAITASNGNINLGKIEMKISEKNTLQEVVIASTKSNDKISIGTKKFAVEQSLVSKGGTATDLLQNIPTVTIDGSGNISLRGSSKVNILIDGKPSLIGGGDITQVLRSLPASSVESIELITNPSSKYEAAGDAGIINIILKKNKKSGFNGTANVFAGTRNNDNGGVGLSFENSKVNLYTNYDFHRSNVWSNGHQDILYLNPADNIVYANEIFPSTTITNAHNIKAGIDYYVTPKSLLSFSGGFNSTKLNRNESLSIQQYNGDKALLQRVNSINLMNKNGTAFNANIDFVKTFNKPKEELVFSIGYAHGNGNELQNYTSYIANINNPVNTLDTTIFHPVNDYNNSYYNVQADYTLPIGTGTLSAGYRTQVRLDNRNQTAYSFNAGTRNYDEYWPYSAYFHSNNQIHALYISYQGEVKRFSYQIGVRGEAANLKGNVAGYDLNNNPLNTPVQVINNRLYPSVTLSEKLGNNQQLQLSYTRRVIRPTPRNYSPIPDISDPVNYDVGNPNIQPEDVHAFELGYQKNWNKINFTSSLYYRITNDFVTHVELPPVNGIITTTAENIPHAYTGGLEVISRFNLVKAWNFTANVNVYENKTDGLPAYGITKSSGLSWNANITNNFTIARSISLQIRGDYQAPNVTAQDNNRANFGVDAGAKINLLHNKATLTINGRDIFATRKWAFLREGNGILLDFERKTTGARAGISFTYNFGGAIFKKKSIEHSAEHQEN
ncbi:outer membrane beta-barrel family protein [Pedobacter kyungheensis]|uniref:outer membrane beta-barrel family protein n=1 Tax=Pedobacter kyungheensis TaxID=1069985 RepID=UPI0009E26E7B|nr:outer membrane beta-barrel family protein [Pedobacter kyungheensis]